MYSNVFIEEVVAWVKEKLPGAHLNIENEFAWLWLDSQKKSICFVGNEKLHQISEMDFTYYITEFHWGGNKEASKSRLCSLLGVTQKIHARQCIVRRISKPEAKLFLDTNHTMGYASSYFHYGLFLKDELVAIASFSKGRRMNRLPENKKSFELIRFCNKNFYTVVGGLSKLVHTFEEEQKPGDIMTYVDKLWGEPHAYYALGFLLEQVTAPLVLKIAFHDAVPIHFTNKGNYKLIKHIS